MAIHMDEVKMERLERIRRRLKRYLALEQAILDGTATIEYRTQVLGARRYDAPIEYLQKMVAALEKQEDAILRGSGMQFVPLVQRDSVDGRGRFM